MNDIDVLIQKLISTARAVDGAPPYEQEPVMMTTGEMALAAKALHLLSAVRHAVK